MQQDALLQEHEHCSVDYLTIQLVVIMMTFISNARNQSPYVMHSFLTSQFQLYLLHIVLCNNYGQGGGEAEKRVTSLT